MADSLSDLMRALQGFRRSPSDGRNPAVVALMTDDDRLPDPRHAVARLPRGSLLIVRSRDPKHLRRQVAALLPVCRRRGLVLLVAGDGRLAHRARAGGVHLPEAAVRRCPRRPWPERPGWLVSAAAHDRCAVHRATRAGVDLVLVSPVFPTDSHLTARPLGPLAFAAMCRQARVPVLALGGISPRTARRLAGSAAAGLAGTGFGLAAVSGLCRRPGI